MPRAPLRGPRKIFQDRNASGAGENKGKFAITFSWHLVGILGIFLSCVIVWAFFMGFMVGQGHNPQTKIRELAGMPPPDPVTSQPDAPSDVDEGAETAPTPMPQPAIKPAEPGKGSAESHPFRTPDGPGLAAWGQKPASKAATPQGAPKKDERQQRDELFDYSFQIAAFKSQADAENLQKKLKGVALKTVIRKSGKVHLLIATMRGNSKTQEALAKKIAPLKLGKPLQLSKKPVPAKTKGNK